MTDEMMALRGLMEKSPDADAHRVKLHQPTGAAQRRDHETHHAVAKNPTTSGVSAMRGPLRSKSGKPS